VGFELRLQAAASSLRAAAIDALLITPGADLRYLVGYDAKPLERLTCLVVPAEGDPIMVVPALEELAALASPLADLGLSIVTWTETEDPIALVAQRLSTAGVVALDDHMWAEKVLKFRQAMPQAAAAARRIDPGPSAHSQGLRGDCCSCRSGCCHRFSA
jgi:Xaa-Pro aminopeptidase